MKKQEKEKCQEEKILSAKKREVHENEVIDIPRTTSDYLEQTLQLV